MRAFLPAPRRRLIQLALVALAALACAAYAQAPASGLYGYDSYFHIKYSDLLRDDLAAGEGLAREFPWWQETFLKDRFADKDLLFHLLLIPFTVGDLEAAGKVASIFFATVLYVSLFLALRWLRAPAPALWTLALLLSSTTLLYRAGLLRSHVLAVSLALLGTAAILRGSRAAVALLSAAYALSHIAWHLLPVVALIHDLARGLLQRRLRLGATMSSLAGTAAAVLASPYFPNNLRLWYVQNVEVLTMAWSPWAPDLSLGTEVRRGAPSLLVYYNAGPVLFTLAGIAMALASLRAPRGGDGESDPEAGRARLLTLGLVAVGFLGLSLMSRRFVEFWAPMSVLFAASAAGGPRAARRPARAWRIALACAGVLLFALLGLHNLRQVRRNVAGDPGRVFGDCAAWIRDHVPEGETVFTTDWDEFPELFFVAPRQRYLVGLDPTFMYVTDPGRWRLWREVAEGRAADIHDPIARTFRCRYVFADAHMERFIERADQDPLFRCAHRDPDCGVYALREADGPPQGAARPAVLAWRLEGGGELPAGPRDFVDVERLSSASPAGAALEGDCAVVRGGLESRAAGSLELSISTDDAVQVRVNGELVFDSASAPPPAIDEVLERQRTGSWRGYERSFRAPLAPGYNEIAVSTCRSGRAWGFYLRLSGNP